MRLALMTYRNLCIHMRDIGYNPYATHDDWMREFDRIRISYSLSM